MHGPLWSPAHHEGPQPRQSGVHDVDPRLRATRRPHADALATRRRARRRSPRAAGVKGVDRPAGGSIQNGPRRLRPIKGLQWQTLVRGDIGRQRLFRPQANPGEVGRAHRTSNGFTEMKRLTALTLTAALARRPSNPNVGLGDHGAIFSSVPTTDAGITAHAPRGRPSLCL